MTLWRQDWWWQRRLRLARAAASPTVQPVTVAVETDTAQPGAAALSFAATVGAATEVDVSRAVTLVQGTPQIARPTADAFVGSWENEVGATTNLFESINEITASDADFVRSQDEPAASPYVCQLEAVSDPLSSAGHVLRYRFDKENVTGAPTVDLTVELRQGYVNEGSPGTVIASATHNAVTDAFDDEMLVLSGAEADAITDYGDLFVRFVADQPG